MPLATVVNPVLGYRTITVPVQLASFGTSAQDLITGLTIGFAGQMLGIDFVTTLAGTGTNASQAFSVKLNSTAVAGLSATINLAGTATTGVVQSFGALTGAVNTNAGGYFDYNDTLTITCAASGTVFTAGMGFLLIRMAKLDGQ